MHTFDGVTDLILRKNIEQADKEDFQDGEKRTYTVWECEETQYRHKGELRKEDVESKFDYWLAIAEGKKEIDLKGIKELQECNATYTGDMMNYFNSEKGKKYFTVLQGQYLKDSSLAKRGDINLNTGHHVNVTVDNGSNAGKGSATNTSTTKSTATLTNKIEVQLPVLKKGSKGVAVSMLQAMLNVNVDGDFGDDTKNALKVFQSNVKIAADGICGADTWKKVVEHMKTSTQ